MANMFEKYAADREAEQKKIEQTVSEADNGFGGRCARRGREAHHALAVAHGERQEGAEDDGGGARDDDCRDYPRVGCGARSEGLVRR